MIKTLLQSFLASSARRVVARDKPAIVAITGSLGKSSTKEAIAVALGTRESGATVRASLKNYNNEYGVPFTVLHVAAPGRDPIAWMRVLLTALWKGWGFGRLKDTILVLEMGADHKGDLAWLTSIAPPTVSVVTSVAAAHSEFFGSIDEVAEEKATLVRALKEQGLAILNNDDSRVTSMRKDFDGQAVYFGESEGSDVRVLHTEILVGEGDYGLYPNGMSVSLEVNGKEIVVALQGTIGKPQAWATAAAFAVANHFHVDPELVRERLERDYHGIAGRTRIIPGIKYTHLIDDSYNAASPEAVISAIKDIQSIPLREEQRRIVALGDMRELGPYSDEAHQRVGQAVAESNIDVLVTCGTLARAIASSAMKQGMDASAIHQFENSSEGGRFIQDILKSGDMVLVKGSQGSRMERIVKELMAEPLQAPFLLVRQTRDWLKR